MPVPAPQPTAESSDSVEVDALLAIVKARFGSYLHDEDIPVIRRGLARIRHNALELQKVAVHNGDAPDCLFHPDSA